MNGTSERATSLRGLPRSNRACPPVYTRGGRSGAPSRSLFPALYRTRMPCSVIRAGGPASTSQESKCPGRGESTFRSVPFLSSSGVHAMRLSDVAMRMSGTLKYIQYIPPTLVAMTRLPSTRARIAPDFDSRFRYLPPDAFANAGPCLVQLTRSRDVATARRGMRRFHCVYVSTYEPSSALTMPGSSTPPVHSYCRWSSLSEYS